MEYPNVPLVNAHFVLEVLLNAMLATFLQFEAMLVMMFIDVTAKMGCGILFNTLLDFISYVKKWQ